MTRALTLILICYSEWITVKMLSSAFSCRGDMRRMMMYESPNVFVSLIKKSERKSWCDDEGSLDVIVLTDDNLNLDYFHDKALSKFKFISLRRLCRCKQNKLALEEIKFLRITGVGMRSSAAFQSASSHDAASWHNFPHILLLSMSNDHRLHHSSKQKTFAHSSGVWSCDKS